MDFKKLFFSLWKRFPVFRLLVIVFTIAFVTTLITLVTTKAVERVPEVYNVSPLFGSPGDIMEISGKNFGSTRSSGYVEIGGSRLTSSSYLGWSDNSIRVILPTNVQNGLVIVGNKSGKSTKNYFFANESGIPVAVPVDLKALEPYIASIEPSVATPGSLVVITGNNFGSARNNSNVLFSSHRDYGKSLDAFEKDDESARDAFEYVSAINENFDYEIWTDTEIHVRVPDGAASGIVLVKTDKGSSNQFAFELKETLGSRIYQNMRHYIIQVNADVEDRNSKPQTSLALRVPRPHIYCQQPYAELLESNVEPLMKNYDNTVCHSIELSKMAKKKMRFTHKFVVYTYALKTQVNENQVKPFVDVNRPLYATYTSPDTLVRSDDSEIIALAKSIIQNETNPYKKAKLIYNYMIENFQVLDKIHDSKEEPVNLLKIKFGDAYDYTICYASLLRACGIPCIPVAGILVDAEKKASDHWWTEFYIENFGWIPVDVALADGLLYKGFGVLDDPKEFYFGNLDSQHIAFSRGWTEISQILSNGSTVYRPKTYAFQSIWEESTAGTVNYSSLWNDPVVVGIY